MHPARKNGTLGGPHENVEPRLPHRTAPPALSLPDGTHVEYRIRTAPRTRSVRLRLTMHDGLTVTAPRGVPAAEIAEFVHSRRTWVQRHLARFDELRRMLAARPGTGRPETVELPALGERWRIEYRPLDRSGLRVSAPSERLAVLSGDVSDIDLCHAGLRRWLLMRARTAIPPRLAALSDEIGLRYASVSVRSQRGRWGSCSADRRISLNCRLLLIEAPLARYVMIHELCHTVELNHSPRFWALVERHVPDLAGHRRAMREAWQRLPAWIDPEPGVPTPAGDF